MGRYDVMKCDHSRWKQVEEFLVLRRLIVPTSVPSTCLTSVFKNKGQIDLQLFSYNLKWFLHFDKQYRPWNLIKSAENKEN